MKHTNIQHQIILLCILATGLTAFYYVRSNTMLQFIIGSATSVAYVFWGIIHHMIQKDLHLNVVIEYILMATIAIVILATVLIE